MEGGRPPHMCAGTGMSSGRGGAHTHAHTCHACDAWPCVVAHDTPWGMGGGGGGLEGWGGRQSKVTHLRRFLAAQKFFACLKEAPKQMLCSLLTSDMLAVLSPVPQ